MPASLGVQTWSGNGSEAGATAPATSMSRGRDGNVSGASGDGMRSVAAGHPVRLLVVEDDEPSRSLLVQLLGDAGFQPDGARDGREALARLTSGEYDAVIIDVNMPGM